MLFRLGPYIALTGSFLAFLALPFGNGVVAREMNIAVFFMLAVMSTEVFGIILIGYGSGSKWSLFGGMREAAQMVSYEIPMAMCVLVPVIVAGSMNLSEVALQQSGGIWNWFVFHDPFTFVAFWTYFTCAMASCKRAPFDLAEAESELVAGFHTEYQRLPLAVHLHGRIRQHVRGQRHRQHHVPRRLEHWAAVRADRPCLGHVVSATSST